MFAPPITRDIEVFRGAALAPQVGLWSLWANKSQEWQAKQRIYRGVADWACGCLGVCGEEAAQHRFKDTFFCLYLTFVFLLLKWKLL